MGALESVRRCIAEEPCDFEVRKPTAVVAVCLLEGETGLDVLLEVRALHLQWQPGEVCLPGGKMEPGESPRDAAIREIAEELLVDASQVEVLGTLGETDGPGGYRVVVLAASIRDYGGTFNSAEVDRTFTKPLEWFVQNKPDAYTYRFEPKMPDDFPWHLVPGGRAYKFYGPEQDVFFYRGTDPLIWGFTAYVMRAFSNALRSCDDQLPAAGR